MSTFTRPGRLVCVLATSVAAMALSLAVPASSSAATASSPSRVVHSEAPDQTQWRALEKVRLANATLGVSGLTHTALALPAGTSTAEKAGVQAEIPAGMEVVVKTSRFTKKEVNDIQKTILDRKWATDAKKYSYSVGYDAQTDSVTVDTDAPDSATASLLRAYPGAVRVNHERIAPYDNRFFAWSPFIGGASISSPSNTNTCSSGFTIHNTHWNAVTQVTAAHCFPLNANVRSAGTNGDMGHISTRFTTADLETIGTGDSDYRYSDYIFDGTFHDSISVSQVVGGTDPYVGLQVCASGQTTYKHCGHTVTSTHRSICYSGTDICINGDNAFVWQKNSAGQQVTFGDSGAPVMTQPNGSVIRGMVSGGDGDEAWGIKLSSILSYTDSRIYTG